MGLAQPAPRSLLPPAYAGTLGCRLISRFALEESVLPRLPASLPGRAMAVALLPSRGASQEPALGNLRAGAAAGLGCRAGDGLPEGVRGPPPGNDGQCEFYKQEGKYRDMFLLLRSSKALYLEHDVPVQFSAVYPSTTQITVRVPMNAHSSEGQKSQVKQQCKRCSSKERKVKAKQPQFPQPLLIRLLLQTLHQLRCPSLGTLQHLNVPLVVGGPKLNTVFEAAFQPLFPKPVALHGVAVAQVQDPTFGLVEPHTIGLGPLIQPVQVPLQSLPTLKQINTPAQIGVICKLTEGALDPLIQIIDKGIKQDWPQHRALGNTTCDWPPTGFNSIHHNSLGPAIQPVFTQRSKEIRLVKQDLPSINPCRLGLITRFSCMCPVMALKMICSITFLGTKRPEYGLMDIFMGVSSENRHTSSLCCIEQANGNSTPLTSHGHLPSPPSDPQHMLHTKWEEHGWDADTKLLATGWSLQQAASSTFLWGGPRLRRLHLLRKYQRPPGDPLAAAAPEE
ncbi:hypothetical protein QYF61_020732 [Mycteria americana]|uniref:Uncharacterized protein n=1 Tax=Mycteria americana TaxID=33587 RepID=A0AAN7PKY3_MYCAM|nr:hypothetical protein QYF61_020732 [Mycteria americana]